MYVCMYVYESIDLPGNFSHTYNLYVAILESCKHVGVCYIMYVCMYVCMQERLRKKKKMKAIKSKNRLITKEVEVTAVQQTWKKFVTKVPSTVCHP
jgi:hypothetical protein